ncbi:hypothetical protein [Cetobacterium sp.]|uniref:hypothetical protein n=1 Tax=Cetobacterium sp. TaxID=2071632 RepID=UPI003F316A46
MRNLYRELITMGYPKSLLDLKLKLHREQYQSELSLIKDLLEVEVLPYRMIQEHKDFIRVKNYFEGVE